MRSFASQDLRQANTSEKIDQAEPIFQATTVLRKQLTQEIWRNLSFQLILFTLAQGGLTSQSSNSFFPDLLTIRIGAYILMLPRFFS